YARSLTILSLAAHHRLHSFPTRRSSDLGIEAEFNNQLAGVRGWRVTETDNRQREIVAYREQEVEPRPGLNVVLTLDLVIQSIVETQLGEAMKWHSPISVSSIVMRPRTGEILALATLPPYDPNRS